MTTYAERLRSLYLESNNKMKAYAALSDQLNQHVNSGRILSDQQMNEHQARFREFQESLSNYSSLLAYVTSNKVHLTAEFKETGGKGI
jgi:hypothetical protein